MATRKLFYEDSHLRFFDAEVLKCEATGKGFEVIVDQTAFYPEGGGQPGDTGTLGGVRVRDTHEKNGEVIHYCEGPLTPGSRVHGEIDYERRFEFMQLHSGEHILSGLIHSRFGYDNVGFHMGSDMVTIDFSGMLTERQLQEAEAAANEIVWKNVPIEVSYPDEKTLPTIPYRSKKALSGWVRIVTIPEADICACCGTHVSATGEIGLIKIFSCVKFHEGVRLEILCGRRAYQYVNSLIRENQTNSVLLSAKPQQTSQAVERLYEELNACKYRAEKLEEQVFSAKAEKLRGAGDVLLFEQTMDSDSLRKFTDSVMNACKGRAAVFAGSDSEGYKYAIGEKEGNLLSFGKAMNAALDGRGGGKPFFIQGSVQADRQRITAFFEEVKA